MRYFTSSKKINNNDDRDIGWRKYILLFSLDDDYSNFHSNVTRSIQILWKWSNLMFVNCFGLCFEHCWYLWYTSTMIICCKNTHCKWETICFEKKETKKLMLTWKDFRPFCFASIYLFIYFHLVITKHREYSQSRLVKLLSKWIQSR